MKRRLLAKLLDQLVYWLDNCSSCVKWCGVLDFGVRQGSVISPFLFEMLTLAYFTRSLITSRTNKSIFKLQFLENSFCIIFN